jgi:hypothetical protein
MSCQKKAQFALVMVKKIISFVSYIDVMSYGFVVEQINCP